MFYLHLKFLLWFLATIPVSALIAWILVWLSNN